MRPFRYLVCALLQACWCPPRAPEPVCHFSPSCVLDVPDQPPAPEGQACGTGKACDGHGACCEAAR